MNTDLTEGNKGNEGMKGKSRNRGIADLRFEILKPKSCAGCESFEG
jgi:hypothetical protein